MAGPGVPRRLVVVRHGETEWSASLRHTGRTDIPLAPEGRERARELASELAGEEFDRVFCSPLRRARETCELAGFGARAELLDDLREWDYGEYEGLTTVEIRSALPGWWLWRDGCPGGETAVQVGERADLALAEMTRDGDESIIAFAHGHLLRVLASRWIEQAPETGARLQLRPGALGVFGWERETRTLAHWNTRSL
jgi:broad specificity phosphatase PhoE